MKKILLLCTAAVSMLFATSCLDNNDSSISGSNQFAVVNTNTSGTKYVTVPLAGMIQGSELNKYTTGDALILSSYKANTGSANSQGILNSEYITIEDDFFNKDQKEILSQAVDTAINVKDQIGFKSLSVLSSSIESAYLNRALVTYSISLADGEKANLAFYYDAEKQKDRQGKDLPSDRAVIDVLVTVTGDGIGDKKDVSDRIVLNTTTLRLRLSPVSFPNNTGIAKNIDLRYSKYNATTQKYTLDYFTSQLGFDYYPSSN